jgi:hypothetical protein
MNVPGFGQGISFERERIRRELDIMTHQRHMAEIDFFTKYRIG